MREGENNTSKGKDDRGGERKGKHWESPMSSHNGEFLVLKVTWKKINLLQSSLCLFTLISYNVLNNLQAMFKALIKSHAETKDR